MKILVVLFAVVAVSRGLTTFGKPSEGWYPARYHRDCSTESDVDPEVLDRARYGDFADDPKLRDHVYCYSKRAGYLNDDDEIEHDVLLKDIQSEIRISSPKLEKLYSAYELVKQCAVAKDTPQETAYEMIRCCVENTPKKYDKYSTNYF